jgi:hypothetical protein
MELATEAKTYRSPAYKLIAFFVKSRDQWKEKCRDGKSRIKRLQNRVEGLKVGRRKWKEKAQAARARVVQLTDALEQQKRASPRTAAPRTSAPRTSAPRTSAHRTSAHRTGTLRATAR